MNFFLANSSFIIARKLAYSGLLWQNKINNTAMIQWFNRLHLQYYMTINKWINGLTVIKQTVKLSWKMLCRLLWQIVWKKMQSWKMTSQFWVIKLQNGLNKNNYPQIEGGILKLIIYQDHYSCVKCSSSWAICFLDVSTMLVTPRCIGASTEQVVFLLTRVMEVSDCMGQLFYNSPCFLRTEESI